MESCLGDEGMGWREERNGNSCAALRISYLGRLSWLPVSKLICRGQTTPDPHKQRRFSLSDLLQSYSDPNQAAHKALALGVHSH